MTKSVSKLPEIIKLGTITAMVEGAPGKPGEDGVGEPGPEGKSAFELWLAQGNTGTITDFFEAYRGYGLNNRGSFAMGLTYKMNDYVTAAGTATDSAIFFCKSDTEFTATAQPRSDSTNWTELVAPAGADGKPVEMQVGTTHIQWRVVGDAEWIDLIAIDALKVKGDPGEDGKSFTVDASGPTAERTQYDEEAEGFAFLDTTTGYLYIHGDGSAVWSDPIPFKGDKGDNGPAIELQKTATYIQWRVVGATTWNNLVAVADLTGANGKNIELQATATYIQWRVVGDTAWTNLIALSSLTGAAGTNGATWLSGTTGPSTSAGVINDWYFNTTTGEIYKKTAAAVWTLQLTLPVSASGGASWLLLTVDPTTQGADGSWALNSANGTIWNRGGTTWNKVMAIPAFATQQQAVAATDYTLMMSPARVREYMESFGLTATFTTTSTNLNLSVHGEFFNYNTDTLNHPGTGGYGRGITIPSGTGYATQLAIENDSNLMFIRYQTAGSWGTWASVGGSGSGSVTFATTEQAQAGTALDVVMSPARTREQFEPLGLGSTYTNEVANLNTLTKGQFFNWGASSTNTPVASSYGRGINIPAGTGYCTQLGIVNDTGATYVRFNNGGTWSAWVKVGPSASSGGGGGTSVFTACMTANTISLNSSSKVTIPTVIGPVALDTAKIYKVSATLLLQGEAGTVVNLSMTDIGSDIYRMTATYALADGTMKRSFSTQDSGAIPVTLSGTDSTITLEGVVHSTYYGPNGPRFQGQIATGNWCNVIKGSLITMVPVIDAPAA